MPAAVVALPATPALLPFQPSERPLPNPTANASVKPSPNAAPQPTAQVTLTANPLVAHLQSAVTVGALWLLVPLLVVVLIFQLRLMQQIRSLTATGGLPARSSPRHYSVSQEEVRALAPDMLPALAHHRFCESRRHQGRGRPARWLELEDTDSDVPLMWATCDTCHHERMTWLRSGREVAVSHD
jgi:hypothetical protein